MNGHAQQDYFSSKPLPSPAKDDLPPIPSVRGPDDGHQLPPKPPGARMNDASQDRFVGLSPIDPSALSPHDGMSSWLMYCSRNNVRTIVY